MEFNFLITFFHLPCILFSLFFFLDRIFILFFNLDSYYFFSPFQSTIFLILIGVILSTSLFDILYRFWNYVTKQWAPLSAVKIPSYVWYNNTIQCSSKSVELFHKKKKKCRTVKVFCSFTKEENLLGYCHSLTWFCPMHLVYWIWSNYDVSTNRYMSLF